jgi:hypothetical protein
MTKTEIRAVLLKNSLSKNDQFLFHKKELERSIDEIHAGFQKALGKDSRKKNTEYADPNGTYYESPKMNSAIQDFIVARKEAKKPMTKRAVEQLLLKFKKGGFTIRECVEAIDVAIIGNYQGVFPKKKFGKEPVRMPDPKTTDYTEGLPTNSKPTI